MNSMQEVLQRAELAEAAYADFFNPNITPLQALLNNGFSDEQATEFFSHWKIIDHIPDTINSDFSATVFERQDGPETGKRYIAVRGTASFADWAEDFANIGSDGIAIGQGIDMYNWYQRMISPAGTVTQYEYHKEETNLLNQITSPAWIETRTIITNEDGALYGGDRPVARIWGRANLIGHICDEKYC